MEGEVVSEGRSWWQRNGYRGCWLALRPSPMCKCVKQVRIVSLLLFFQYFWDLCQVVDGLNLFESCPHLLAVNVVPIKPCNYHGFDWR